MIYAVHDGRWRKTPSARDGKHGPSAVNGNQWVAYDDIQMAERKANFVKEMVS